MTSSSRTQASWLAPDFSWRDGQADLILAGPNDAGKATFARELLVREVSCPAFVVVLIPPAALPVEN